MPYPDLELFTQVWLIGLTVATGAGFMIRAVAFVRLESVGVRPLYPNSWNVVQCRALERFRLLIGLGLVTLWGVYLFFVPSKPTNWPFGYLEAISLISMLSVSYAWAVLLAARDWSRLDAIPRSFLVIITFLAFWWGTAFSAIGWILAETSAPPPFRMVPPGVYAQKELPPDVEAAW
jgi:hypothetical protein